MGTRKLSHRLNKDSSHELLGNLEKRRIVISHTEKESDSIQNLAKAS